MFKLLCISVYKIGFCDPSGLLVIIWVGCSGFKVQLFVFASRYTEQSDISRARVWFFNGTKKIMLYTERAHFYHRYKVLSWVLFMLSYFSPLFPAHKNAHAFGSLSSVLFMLSCFLLYILLNRAFCDGIMDFLYPYKYVVLGKN